MAVKYLPCGGAHPLQMLKNMWFAFRNQGDVNHITGDCHYIALAMNPRKTILTVHDCAYISWLSGVRKWCFQWLWFGLPCRIAHRVTTIYSSTRDELAKVVKKRLSNVIVIANCVDPNVSFCEPVVSAKPRFLQVGTQKQKNLDRVAAALDGMDCHLRIIGELSREQTEILSAHHIEYSNVWNISDEELVEEYVACTAVLFVSLEEGFGLPILEAQASGRPLITSDLSPMCDVAGEGALLADPHDEESIRRQVESVLRGNVREELVQLGLQNVKRYSACEIAGCYLDLYKMLFERSSSLREERKKR